MDVHPSDAFWRLNSDVPESDHPRLGSNPFDQKDYEVQETQVLSIGPAFSEVKIPRGSQLWKGLSWSTAKKHGYIQKSGQKHVVSPRPQFKHSGFYGSQHTATQYALAEFTKEEADGIEITFVTAQDLTLIDIGNVDTVNAIVQLILTTTEETVVSDPRYYYFYEAILRPRGSVDNIKTSHQILVQAPKTVREKVLAVADYLYKNNVHDQYYDEGGIERDPLQAPHTVDTREGLRDFIKSRLEAQENRRQFINDLFDFYTYRPSFCDDKDRFGEDAKIDAVCDAYFAVRDEGFDDTELRTLIVTKLIFAVELSKIKAWQCLKDSLAEQDDLTMMNHLFEKSCRHSESETDKMLVRLLEQFVLRWQYFDGWIYFSDEDAKNSNLDSTKRSMVRVEDEEIENTFHSEIYLTEAGRAKIEYVGYNRFDS